jgi:uncharacterized membrane protein
MTLTLTHAIGMTIIATMIGSTGMVFLKKGSANIHRDNLLAQFKNWQLMIGIGLFIPATLLYLIALKYGDLSVIYPFSSLSYIWVALLATFFLKEDMNKLKGVGIALIIIGIILITR